MPIVEFQCPEGHSIRQIFRDGRSIRSTWCWAHRREAPRIESSQIVTEDLTVVSPVERENNFPPDRNENQV